jgi:hypothetical protein
MEAATVRKRPTIAVALLVADFAFGYLWRLVIGPLLLHRPTTTHPNPTYAVVCVDLLLAGMCYAILLGKQWAVWVFAGVFALEVLLPALDYKALLNGFQQQPLTTVPFIATYLLQGFALWLLLSKKQ